MLTRSVALGRRENGRPTIAILYGVL